MIFDNMYNVDPATTGLCATGSLTKDMATLPRITPDMEMMLMYIYRLLYGRKALR